MSGASVGPAPAATWLGLSQRAVARAAELGLPTTRLEAWRYVDLKPMERPPTAAPLPITGEAVRPHLLPGMAATLVLVNGAYRADLSSLHRLPDGIAVEDLFLLPAAEATALAARWTAELAASDDVSACWTIADLGGGLRLRARGENPAPIQVLNLASGGCHGARLLIELAAQSSLEVVLTHVDVAPSRSSLGIEIEVGAGARLRVDEVQYGESTTCQVHALAWMRVQRDGELAWTSAAAGGDLVRMRSEAVLEAGGAQLDLAGLAVLSGGRQAHQYLRVRHGGPSTTSRQLFKNIAGDRAQASFDGLVRIDKGADGANAEQRNHNLITSPKARIDTRPQLDILADDVKASHGATVGRPNPEEILYLRMRGIPLAAATALLTRGFAQEVVARMRCPAARELAERRIVAPLVAGA